MSCSELPPFVLLLPVTSSVGNKESPAEFQSSAGHFAIKCFGSDIVSGNQFLSDQEVIELAGSIFNPSLYILNNLM